MTLALVILIGGASRRMGRDKALLRRDGRRVVDRLVELACDRAMPCWLSGRSGAAIARPELPHIADESPQGGPLVALASCLRRLQTPLLLLACDLPWADGALLDWLRDAAQRHPDADAIWPGHDGRTEPCAAVYRPRLLPVIDALLVSERRALHGLHEQVLVLPCPPRLHGTLRNCNRPEDLGPSDALDWDEPHPPPDRPDTPP